MLLLLLALAGCGRETPAGSRGPVRERVAAAKAEKKERTGGTLTAEGGELSWEDEQGRPLLVVKMASVTGSGSATGGMAGPVTLNGAECRLFEDGKPTTWLKAPVVVWENERLVASKGATAGSVDGRMSAQARTAEWTAKQRLLELGSPVCQARRPGEPALVAEGPKARWTAGVLTLPAGVQAHTADGAATMRAQRMSWRSADGRLQASGKVEMQRADARARCEQMQGDTRIRRVVLTGSPRIEVESGRAVRGTAGTTRRRAGADRRGSGVGGRGSGSAETMGTAPRRGGAKGYGRGSAIAAVLAVGMGLTSAAAAPEQQRRDVPAQSIVLVADRMVGDWVALNLELVGKASLTSPETTMTSDRMTLKGEKGGNRIASASASGNVRLRSQAEANSTLTATGTGATYLPAEDRATLTGGVKLQFTSPQLAEPATLVGERVELALSSGKAVVYRTPAAPVVVVMRPKGGEGPVELRAERVEVDTRGGAVTATGEPVMKFPRGTLTAEKIWFELDKATNDVREARAAGNVRVNAAWEDGRTAEGHSERATFLRAENKITMEGNVQLTQNAPELETPRRLNGGTVSLDLKTRQVDVQGAAGKPAELRTPFTPKPAKGPTNANQHR